MSKQNRSGKNKKDSHLFKDILKEFQKNPGKLYNYKQMSASLGIESTSAKILVEAALKDLTESGNLLEPDRGKYKLIGGTSYVTGIVDMLASGSAYIVSPDTEQDIYIGSRHLAGAWHGDKVKVYLFPQRKSRKPEGEIIEITERARTEFVGTIQLGQHYAFLIPDNNKINTDIFIPLPKLNGALDGQKAVAKITHWHETSSRNPEGEIVRVLGNPGDNDTEMHAILEEYGLPYEFPVEVERIADLIPVEITPDEIAKRRDFRNITTFTIDPVDAKDFDDALSIKKLENGNWEIGVHIADVSHYLKEDSLLDKEAVSRATSVYLVDRVVPMLPEILSNNVCSLRPNEEKLCFSAVFEISESAEVVNEWFGRTVILSDHRFTYEEAQFIIETEEGKLKDEILTLDRLAKILRKERFSKGAFGFDKIEIKFHIDEKGFPTGVYFKEQKDSNKLIEEFMLLANRRVAEFIGKNKKLNRPFVYRIHDSPNQEKLANFSQFIYRFGYKINIKSDKELASSMNKLLKEVVGKKEENIIEQLAIRTMAKAIYTTENIGHYGLAFSYYTHFTSPIRRYPDVMVHRLLQYYLDGNTAINADELEMKCKHSSDMEKRAAEAERASTKYKQVQFLQDKIGQTFEGIISGVTEWGIFVNKCEGLIRTRELRDDFYEFDEDTFSLVGRKSGRKYQLGDKLKITVKKADLIKKQLDFVIAEEKSSIGGMKDADFFD